MKSQRLTEQQFNPLDMPRVFIGIPVDQKSRRRIKKLLKPIKHSQQYIRWVPANNWHLTLAFLGNTPVPTANQLLRSFVEAYQQEASFRYQLSLLTRFPGANGSIIALTSESTQPLEDLFQNTLMLLRRIKIKYDRTKLRPHITLGRIKQAKQLKTTIDQQVNVILNINKITLYQSTLTASGSVYSALIEAPLIR